MDVVRSYRQMHQLNGTPIRTSNPASASCSDRSATPDPHAAKYITVFVNDRAYGKRIADRAFPVGAVIVKEKRGRRSS